LKKGKPWQQNVCKSFRSFLLIYQETALLAFDVLSYAIVELGYNYLQ
jgi:hypothetical protein